MSEFDFSTYTNSSDNASNITLKDLLEDCKRLIENAPAPPPISFHTSKFLTDNKQIKFPRCKKKRVQKKWAKKLENYLRVPSNTIYILNLSDIKIMHPAIPEKEEKVIFMHPELMDLVKQQGDLF